MDSYTVPYIDNFDINLKSKISIISNELRGVTSQNINNLMYREDIAIINNTLINGLESIKRIAVIINTNNDNGKNKYDGLEKTLVTSIVKSLINLINIRTQLMRNNSTNLNKLNNELSQLNKTLKTLSNVLTNNAADVRFNYIHNLINDLNNNVRIFSNYIDNIRLIEPPSNNNNNNAPPAVMPSDVAQGVAAAMEEDVNLQRGNNLNNLPNREADAAFVENRNRIIEELNAEERRNAEVLISAYEAIAATVKGIPYNNFPPIDSGIGFDFVGGIGTGLSAAGDAIRPLLERAGLVGPMTRRRAALIVASGAVIGASPFIGYAGIAAMTYLTYELLSINYAAPVTALWEYLGYNKNDIVIEEQESGSTTITNESLKQGATVDKDGNVSYHSLEADDTCLCDKVYNWVTSSFSAMVGALTTAASAVLGYLWDNSGNIVRNLYGVVRDVLNYGTQTTLAIIGVIIAGIGLAYNFYKKK